MEILFNGIWDMTNEVIWSSGDIVITLRAFLISVGILTILAKMFAGIIS